MFTDHNPDNRLSPLTTMSESVPSDVATKNELKKRAKQLEKDKKAAEKAAKQEELARQKAEADVVCLLSHPFPLLPETSGVGLCCRVLWAFASTSVTIPPAQAPHSNI
jgi:hypothetical protein